MMRPNLTFVGVLVGLACAAAPTAQEAKVFHVGGTADRPVVTANRSGVPVDEALRALSDALGWRVNFETEQLRGRLSVHAVDVAFTEQNPRTVAHLLSVAGGGDIVFSDRTQDGRQHTTMMVVSPPSNETESGRQRLREWSARWYRTFLQDELDAEPLVETFGMDARMNLGRLLMEQGALEDAAMVFAEVQSEDPSHAYVPAALLKLARCRFELGEAHWDAAENAARELTRRHPSLPEAAAGTVLLGEILLARGQYEACVKTLTASYLRLSGTPEIISLYLLVGRAEYQLGRPDPVLRTMSILDGAHDYRELKEGEWLDYLFLRGYALHELGQHEDAMEPLEIFLGTGSEDHRRGIAFILLGRSYMGLERIVEARAAAIEAHNLKVGGQIKGKWAREASKFYAKTALEIGEKAQAFDKLEVEVRKSPESEPDLVVYLVEAFIAESRYQKAIITADLIAHLTGADGDRARFLRIEAMWKQSVAAGGVTLRTFPSRALPLVEHVTNTADMRRIAELFGKAYELTGEIDKAADAYRGLLR